MELEHMVADDDLRAELLGKLGELADALPTGLEGLDGGLPTTRLAEGVERMAEGVWDVGENPGLEAIVHRFTRPVLLVQDSTFVPSVDGFPESEVVTAYLASARSHLDTAIVSVGRIDLRNHRLHYAGTGWVVAPNVVATNRHVAEMFAAASNGGFAFRSAFDGRKVAASIDWRREHGRPDESIVAVDGILWIEPDGGPDVALLHIAEAAGDGSPSPQPIPLMSEGEIAATLDTWVAVIGYPAQDSRNDSADQQRIFDGIYDVKRLAPGTVMSFAADGVLHHDASTLGGTSGSVVVDLASGKAAGLHFGGIQGSQNFAVKASVVAALVEQHGG